MCYKRYCLRAMITNRKNAVSNLVNARSDTELTAQEVDNSILLSANMGYLFEMSWEIDDKRA